MTSVRIQFQGAEYTLTDEHASGAPVLIDHQGRAWAPWDNVIDKPDARMSGGERYHWQMTARAIAGYIRDDHPNDAGALDLLRRFEAVRNPGVE